MIPDEAVEAAARGIYATEEYPIYDEAKEEFTGSKPWEWLNERSQDNYRNKARKALEAAAPRLTRAAQEQAWEEGRADGYADAQRGYDLAANPYLQP